MEACFNALKSTLKVVVIDLERDDDAQVIFETLNARGEPLLPADLLRNYIFLRAAREGAPQEELYNEYWKRFDDQFWRTQERQGRLIRPRSDLLLQHFLASKQATDIPIKHLFVEYKTWIDRTRPFSSVRDELAAIARAGDHFRRIISPTKDDPLQPLSTFLQTFDTSTAYPLLLHVLDAIENEQELREIGTIIESYVLRRAVCNLPVKAYNRIFLGIIKTLRRDRTSLATIKNYLASLTGQSGSWPTDDEFHNAWTTAHAYRLLQNPKIVHLYRRLNQTYQTNKQETLVIEGALTVEHLMPQGWQNHWPLAAGIKGMTFNELVSAPQDDPRSIATRARDRAVQTLGNLTILTHPLNSSLSNSSWRIKKHCSRLIKPYTTPNSGTRLQSPLVVENSISVQSNSGRDQHPYDPARPPESVPEFTNSHRDSRSSTRVTSQ